MAFPNHRFVVFGDQTVEFCSTLSYLISQDGSCKEEKEFLRKIPQLIRDEITRFRQTNTTFTYSSDHLNEIVTCRTIDDIIDRYSKKDPCVANAAFDGALLCITQIIQIFRLFNASESRISKDDERSTIIGLCTGGLAAAVLNCSSSKDDVSKLALPTVRIAIRVGLHAGTVSDSIHKQDAESRRRAAWSVSIADLVTKDAEDRLQELHSSLAKSFEEVPISRRCYITAVGQTGITISGSPNALEHLLSFTKDKLPGNKTSKLPIYAAFHIPDIYEDLDLDWLLSGGDDTIRSLLQQSQTYGNQLYASDGSSIKDTSAWDLLKTVVRDIFMKPLRWDQIVASAALAVRTLSSTSINITSIGASGPSGSLASGLRTSLPGTHVQEIDMLSQILDNATGQREPINEPLAIVGLAGRFPDAADHEELWQLLMKGLDVHKEIPADRFDKTQHVDPTGKKPNTSWTPYGCFMDNPGFFDPAFFHISPREALQTDPMQRLALVTAYEALEMAGYTPDRTPSTRRDRIGTFYGQTSDDYREVNAAQKVDTYFIPGGIRAFGPGRINYHFKFSGPSFNIDTACSSSFSAIQLACTSIWSGDCDTAVAGGLSVLTSSDLFSGLSRGQFLSKTGSCKTFDNAADGYCRADAVASVVIKRLSEAKKDNDKILATISAMRTNHSADAISITHPHAETQMKLYRQILSDAGISPHDVNLIEMHGTGTQAGDGIEMRSVSEVFANTYKPRNASNPLYVGSVKANVGHGEAASGVTALIKSIMMLGKKTIPPHVGIKGVINQKFPDLNARNIKICMEATHLEDNDRSLTMMVNNFSAAGGNTAMILKASYDNFESVKDSELFPSIITLSGHTVTAMKNNIARFLSYLDTNPDTDPRHLSYTTTARRMHYKFRTTVTGKSVDEIKSALARSLQKSSEQVSKTAPRKMIICFTGQGALYADIGKRIFRASTQARLELEKLDRIVVKNSFASIMPFLEANSETAADLTATQSQLGLLCVQITLFRMWTSLGIKPDGVIGHSLGEYAALYAADVLSAADAIYLVGRRAQLMEKYCKKGSHCMLAVKSTEDMISELIKSSNIDIDFACLNAKEQTILSGSIEQVDAFGDLCKSKEIKTNKLNLPYAFHSSQVDCILDEFEEVSKIVQFRKPSIAYLSALLGRQLQADDQMDGLYLRRHARESVKFASCLATASNSSFVDESTIFLEIGVQPLCTPMIRSTIGSQCISLSTMEKSTDLEHSLASTFSRLHNNGVALDWNLYQNTFNSEPRLLHLPSYAFDNKDYWIAYNNNWLLTKHQFDTSVTTQETSAVQPLLSSSVHRLVESDFKSATPSAAFETDLCHKALHEVLTGHLVNGAGLCSSSVYADIAMTAADHLREALDIEADGLAVCSMEITSPLNVRLDPAAETRTLRLQTKLNESRTKLNLEYFTYDKDSQNRTKHAHCVVEFGKKEQWKQDWNRINYLLVERLDQMTSKASNGQAHKILQGMAYKLFSSLVDYSPKFQNMKVVTLDCPAYEGMATVRLSKQDTEEKFRISPYWIDSLVHLAGLIMNGNDQVDPSVVYISHGWENMSFAELPQADQDYSCYVKMRPTTPKIYAGDVWILKGDTVVGVCKALKFQCVSRNVLNSLLPPAHKSSIMASNATKVLPKREFKGVDFKETVQRLESVKTVPRRKSSISSQGSLIIKNIIAEEVGVSSVDENSGLAELGIDSLLALTIADKIREQTDARMSPDLFVQCSTVKDIISHCGMSDAEDLSEASESSSSSSFGDTGDPLETGMTTPGFDNNTNEKLMENDDDSAAVKSIIAEELGFAENDISNDADLSVQGMDSLMMLSIQNRLQETFSRPIPQGFLTTHNTVEEIQKVLCHRQTATRPVSASQSTSVATSLVLHNPQPRSPSRTLFLFPDGSGSAASYIDLPNPGQSIRVVALNSPFLRDPSRFSISLEEIVRLYLAEIKSRQPRGPYHLGGWSVGGVFAFEACRQLFELGEKVDQLLLIDSPSPTVQDPMPQELISYLDGTGLFERGSSSSSSSRKNRKQLLAHFEASVKSLERYDATPLANSDKFNLHGCNMVVHVLEASQGVCDKVVQSTNPPPSDLEGSNCAKWILNDRENGSGSRDWSTLLSNVQVKNLRLEGNHFTIMRKPNVGGLGRAIRESLAA